MGPPFTSPETLFGAYAAFHRSILDSAKRDNRLPRILLCQPMYGIGNRMRAMMSCLLTGLGSFPSFSPLSVMMQIKLIWVGTLDEFELGQPSG